MSDEREKNATNTKHLETCLGQGEVVAFIGSGLSVDVYPGWRELVEKICIECKLDEIIDDGCISEKLLELCDDARNNDPKAYSRVLVETFDRLPTTRVAYRYLLQANFRNYLTTNFDILLADEVESFNKIRGGDGSLVYTYPACSLKALHERKTASYLHGYIVPGIPPGPRNPIVLSKTDFDTAYAEDSMLPLFLNSVFTEYPVCFIGCQLQEVPLLRILAQAEHIRAHLGTYYSKVHNQMFILLEEWDQRSELMKIKKLRQLEGNDTKEVRIDTQEDESSFYEGLGIKVVRFPRKKNHRGLDDLLMKWGRVSEPTIYEPRMGGSSDDF